MNKIFIDPGHGGKDPGALGNGLKEKDAVLDIAIRTKRILEEEYLNIKVKMSREDDSYVSLDRRVKMANEWGANFYLSIHTNAFNRKAHGYDDYIFNKLLDSGTTAQWRDILHQEINTHKIFNNRCKKKENFAVLRETVMPAVLTENGFIDNAEDARKLNLVETRELLARAYVNGVGRIFDLKPTL